MRILILGFAKVKFMPYANFYLENINLQKNDVDFIYWNRDLKHEDLSKFDKRINFIEFRETIDDSSRKFRKITHFYKYRKFVKDILSSRKYDIIISLHTLPGLLVLDKLKKNYGGKYIIDYRDSTFESNKYFGKLIKILARNAKLVFVSSDAFRRYLPSTGVDILTSHNLLTDSLYHRDDRKTRYIKNDKIRISFWGRIRHYQHNIMMINRLANDPRFELHYYGREFEMGDALRKYLKEHHISNVFLHGEYEPCERYDFACKTDIIHNSYYDNNMMLAMGNKYYDGIIFRIPLLCMSGSYMAERCTKRGVGFAFDPHDLNYADEIYQAYKKTDFNEFDANCDKELQNVLDEYRTGCSRIQSIFNN